MTKHIAYTFGKHGFKFVLSGYINACHFQKPMLFFVPTKRKSTNDIIFSDVLTFGMLDTYRRVTQFNVL